MYASFPQNSSTGLKLIGDLPSIPSTVDVHTHVGDVARIFNKNPTWTGVILTFQNQFWGLLSRRRCFEALGKPFGIEIYSKQSILEFYRQCCSESLVLDAATPIPEAVRIALSRGTYEMYDPLAVRHGDQDYRLLDMHTLLSGQSELLENLYREVQKLSIRDPLTNIANRRGFFDAARPEVAASENEHTDMSALMIDIDHFKVVNDIYGHFVGDWVIRAVAEECQRSLRQTDLLGRFGGEEFIALLPDTSPETACKIAERLRAKIEELVVFIEGYQISVTISVGVCHLRDAKGSLDNLLTQADQAMYAAKWAGRNQVMVWDPYLAHQVRKDIHAAFNQNSQDGSWAARRQTAAARIYDETIEGWAHALELRDRETLKSV